MFLSFSITSIIADLGISGTQAGWIATITNIGGFSSVIIGIILDASSARVVMLFLSGLYLISFVAMLSIGNLKQEKYSQFQ